MIVHFPIALLLVGLVSDLMRATSQDTPAGPGSPEAPLIDPSVWGQLGLWCTTFGTIMLLPSIGTGLLAQSYQAAPDPIAASVINWHERVSYLIVLWFGALIAWRWDSRGQSSERLPLGYGLAAGIGGLLLIAGASLGGQLVYEHGMGISHDALRAEPLPGNSSQP